VRDISRKISTLRTATARATLRLAPETIGKIRDGKIPKGAPLEVAKVAAVQAAKETSRIIPYCHPLPIDFVGVEYEIGEGTIQVDVLVKTIAKTGVEMEALTGASVAALTLYDMMKMLDAAMGIEKVTLLEKKGGKSDFTDRRSKGPRRAAVLVISDSVSAGQKSDRSGRLIVERLENEGLKVEKYEIVPDEPDTIVERLLGYSDDERLDLVLNTGGTGFSPRDNTPEAMSRVVEREVPGIPEATRAYGQDRTPYSMLSRGRAGIRGTTLIINLPGSSGGVADSLDALFPGLLHGFGMLAGGGHDKKKEQR
jgi:molybdenum cofactor biosynthesis protein MoaC